MTRKLGYPDSLTQYIGTTAESKPTAMPAMARPTIIMPILMALAWRAHPSTEMQAPMKTVNFRPRRSGSQAIDIAPSMAPPVKEDTIPPVWEAVDVPMYASKYGWTMVEEMIPLS
jgi:hypothetical protein